MSVERVRRKSGVAYRVRWREGDRNRARTFDSRRDAELFEGEIRRRKQLGDLASLDAGRESLDEYVTGTWVPDHVSPHLAPKTQRHYAELYDRHVAPYLGQTPLREITPELVGRWSADRLRSGAGRTALRHAFVLLASILEHAVRNGRIVRNAARLTQKPKKPQRREIRPLAPGVVERMRAAANARDATLISVLAYAGLRPGEALGLRWSDVQDQTILIERAISLGGESDTKTRQHRSVRLLSPLKSDLAEWRMACGRPDEAALVFPGVEGTPWSEPAYQSWRRRAFKRAYEAAGLGQARVYDLRHSFASLLLHEGRSAIYVAKQLGHAARLTLDTYGHVIDELEDAPNLSAEDAIKAARAGAVPASYPKAAGAK